MSLTLVTCTVPVVFELVSETTLISGEAAAFARSKGAGRFEISLTHTDTLAQAVVAALPE